VQSPGRAWGLAGYSEGGYCTANIAPQDPAGFGAAGVMSGYFSPIRSQVPAGNKPGGKPRVVDVFAGRPALQQLNSPRWYITRVPVSAELPPFWLAAGAEDRPDVDAAVNFRQLALQAAKADVAEARATAARQAEEVRKKAPPAKPEPARTPAAARKR
jgi:S-formylglutathione hydrolase FrmB